MSETAFGFDWHIMKTVKRLVLSGVVALFVISVSGKDGKGDGVMYGYGDDSVRCVSNISLYTECLKYRKFDDAYVPWKSVFTEAPLVRPELYAEGVEILHALISGTEDANLKMRYFYELMDVYDRQIKYLDALNSLSNDSVTRGIVLGKKAHDYVLFSGAEIDTDKAYDMLCEAIVTEKDSSDFIVLQDWVYVSLHKLKSDRKHEGQFIRDYLTASGYLGNAYRTADDDKKELLKILKNNIESHFINSGLASGKNLQKVYGPKIEENKNNPEYLKQAVCEMEKLKCTGEDAYCAALETLHEIEPSVSNALKCAFLNSRKNDIYKVLHYFDAAVGMEEDTLKKAEYCYKASVVLYERNQLDKARQYAREALSYNGKCGKAYLLIARMYASCPNWSNEDTLNKCTYYAAIDKLQCAENVDPDISGEVRKLIAAYTEQTPKEKDLAFLGLKKGETISIGGWIGETTTIK